MSAEQTIKLPPLPPRKTLRDLKEWLNALPPECDTFDVESTVGGQPLVAKRVIAYRDGKSGGLVVNSMGTHLEGEFWNKVEIVSFWTP